MQTIKGSVKNKSMDKQLEVFEQHRKILEGLAYRMMGTLCDAQEIVQDTYLKWHDADQSSIGNAKAWLITVCSRLAINRLDKAYFQRETYVGDWLPEPFPDSDSAVDEPSQLLETSDSLSMALLVTLESLTPSERAAFLLHDVFEMGFDEIAASLQLQTEQSRQLASRARKKVVAMKPRFVVETAQHEKLLNGFLNALDNLDTSQLVSLLSEEIKMYSDGGGQVSALRGVLVGNNEVARFFIKIFTGIRKRGSVFKLVPQRFNGALGILVYQDNVLSTALNIETDGNLVHRLYAVRNPDKLQSAFPRSMALPDEC